MNKYTKRIALAIPLLGWLVLALSVQAASFDCGKAQNKVEHLICDNSKLSELDSKLGQIYQDVLSKANDEQKQRVMVEQKHWLKYTRNVCTAETCLKLAYWSRQAELETFFEPKTPLYKHEADKAEAIKQVLASAPLYPMYDTPFCRQIFDDLKQMKDIRFVDPVVQTQSYEDPALDPWIKQCRSLSQPHFHYDCERNITPASVEEAINVCDVGYGLSTLKLYELPPTRPSDSKRYVFYTDDGYGPMNQDWKKPALGGGFAGFQQINLANCKPVGHSFGEVNGTNYMGNVFADAGRGGRNGKNYNSIIKYKKQYYFFVLNKQLSSWWLEVEAIAPNGSKNQQICDWTPVAPRSNTSNQGSK